MPDSPTALMTKDKLKAFHRAKGIRYLVLEVNDMIDSLSIQDIPLLQQLLNVYAEHRQRHGKVDSDLEWAMRAMTRPGELTFETGQKPSPELLQHVAGLLSTKFSPQPVIKRAPDGTTQVVSVPKPEDAVPRGDPKVQAYLQLMAEVPQAGLQRTRSALGE